jgi:hypothetical protein
MYLMKQVIADIQTWIDGELGHWMKSLREMIEAVRSLSSHRASALRSQLEERVGPVLKISRSKSETLVSEMEKLSREPVRPNVNLLHTIEGDFQGLFAVKVRQEVEDNRRIFLALKNDLQAPLLRRIEEYGAINVATEVKNQGRTAQVADHFRDAQAMSVATRIGLVKSPSRVPSFLLARDNATADVLIGELSQALGNPPQVSYQPLSLFDHMIVFYQEGACSVEPDAEYHAFPDVLSDAETYREHYQLKMKVRPDVLDPLGSVKAAAVSAAGGGVK